MAKGDPILLTAFVLILILFLISLVLLVRIFGKYKQRKSKVAYYLGLTFLLMSVGILFIGIGALLEYFGFIENNDIIIMITMTFFLMSILVSAHFIQEVFGLHILKFIKIFQVFLPALIVIYVVIYFIIEAVEFNLAILLFSFTNMLLFFTFYTYLAVKSLLVRKRLEDSAGRKSFFSIFLMGILMDFAFVCIAIDSLSLTMTPFFFIGLISAIISIIAAYLGFVQPASK